MPHSMGVRVPLSAPTGIFMFNKSGDLLLHHVMEALCEFAETKIYKQYPNDVIASLEYLKDNTQDLKYEYQELYTVYKWYKIDRPKRTVKKDIGLSMMYYEQDSKMLSRAVAIRKFSNKLFKGGDYDTIEFNHATQKSIGENKQD